VKPAGPYLLRWVGRRQVREGGQVPVIHDDSVSMTDLPFIPRRSARRYRARLEGAGVGPPVLGTEELSPEKDSFDLGFLTTVSAVMREGGDEGTGPRETPHRELGFNVGCLQVGDEQKVHWYGHPRVPNMGMVMAATFSPPTKPTRPSTTTILRWFLKLI